MINGIKSYRCDVGFKSLLRSIRKFYNIKMCKYFASLEKDEFPTFGGKSRFNNQRVSVYVMNMMVDLIDELGGVNYS